MSIVGGVVDLGPLAAGDRLDGPQRHQLAACIHGTGENLAVGLDAARLEVCIATLLLPMVVFLLAAALKSMSSSRAQASSPGSVWVYVLFVAYSLRHF